MPAQGIVTVAVSPFDARMIAWWLRAHHQPKGYTGILGEYLWRYRDHHDVDAVAKKFEKLIARKRPGGPFVSVEVQIARADAAWLAQRVRRSGIFAHRPKPNLPDAVAVLCCKCALALMRKRGRPKLRDADLDAAIVAQVRKYEAGAILEQRHLKRLKRRKREEEAMKRSAASFTGLLGDASMKAEKST